MFNPVSKAIYGLAGITREKALEGANEFRRDVWLKGVPRDWQDFDLDFPLDNKIRTIWNRVVRVSFRAQVGGFVLTGVGIIGAFVKYQQKSLPQAALSAAIAATALFVGFAARIVENEALEQRDRLKRDWIQTDVRELRLGAVVFGPKHLKDPSDVRFFTDKEVGLVLEGWISRELSQRLQCSSSSSSSSSSLLNSDPSWTLDELNNPENKVVQAFVGRLGVNHSIKNALNICKAQNTSKGFFVADFLKLYNEFLAKGLD